MEIKIFCYCRQFRHVFFAASGMTADEVGYDLLAQVTLGIDAVEDAFEVAELLERRLAHEVKHTVGNMLRCHFQSSTDMVLDEFLGVFCRRPVGGFVFGAMEQEVVAHSAAYVAVAYLRQCINGTVDVDEFRVVGVEIWAYLRMNATWA